MAGISAVTTVTTAARAAVELLRRWAAEILQLVAIVVGWLLVTRGVVALSTPKVWPISIGLLLLSVAGWGYLATFFWCGLYKLTHSETRDG